jgi:hypothetical protein
MSNFAQVQDGVVVNIIVADNDFISILPNSNEYIEYSEDNPAFIGGEYENGFFYPLKPFSSWLKNGSGSWIAPIERPENALYWDEENMDWVLVEEYTG